MPRRRRLTWETAVNRYEDHLRARRCSRATIDAYLRHLRLFREHVPKTPDRVEVHDLRTFQLGLHSGECARSKKPLSAAAVANVSTALRGFFGFLLNEGLLKEDPAARLEQPKLPRRLPGDVISVEQVQSLLAAAEIRKPLGRMDRTLLEVLYATGVRRGEICSLDLRDMDLQERTLVVRHGKGNKARKLPLARSCANSLTAYLQETRPKLCKSHPDSLDALFLTRNGRRIDASAVVRSLARLKKRAKLTDRLTAHTLRRTFATHLLKNGVSLRHIQLLLGHENLATTAIYLSLDLEDLRRELLQHHPRELFEV